jgi:hypothetical protein
MKSAGLGNCPSFFRHLREFAEAQEKLERGGRKKAKE